MAVVWGGTGRYRASIVAGVIAVQLFTGSKGTEAM